MSHPDFQKGVTLLVAMMMLLAGSAFYLSTGIHQTRQAEKEVLDSLLAAKQALIAYAVNYADNYGHNTRGGTGRLPCPSLAPNSTPMGFCQSDTVGYLPSVWLRDDRLMEIDYLERFLDRDIWYAVSAEHRYNPSFNVLNSIPGPNLFQVDSMQDIAAVLIAPGPAADGQDRGTVAGLTPQSSLNHYLEGENADRDAEFTVTEHNDVLVPIRRSELVPLMERRVLGYVKEWLIEYKALYGFYPYAAALGGAGDCEPLLTRGMLPAEAGTCSVAALADTRFMNLPSSRMLRQTWFYRYGWPDLIYYLVDDSCTPPNGAEDCDGIDDPERELQVNGQPVEVILISVGAPINTEFVSGMQQRGQPGLSNYLDTEALLTATTDFVNPPLSMLSNDQLVFIE